MSSVAFVFIHPLLSSTGAWSVVYFFFSLIFPVFCLHFFPTLPSLILHQFVFTLNFFLLPSQLVIFSLNNPSPLEEEWMQSVRNLSLSFSEESISFWEREKQCTLRLRDMSTIFCDSFPRVEHLSIRIDGFEEILLLRAWIQRLVKSSCRSLSIVQSIERDGNNLRGISAASHLCHLSTVFECFSIREAAMDSLSQQSGSYNV